MTAAEIKDQHQRVAALIAELDQGQRKRQMGQPGGIALRARSNRRCSTMHEGDTAAVLPLLDCLEHDNRLTRSVHFWRDFSTSRSPIGVHEAAYVAISGIIWRIVLS